MVLGFFGVNDVLCRVLLTNVEVWRVEGGVVVNVCSMCVEDVVLSELCSDVFDSLAGEDFVISKSCP